MSTKINTGFRIRGSNLLDMHQRVKQFRSHAHEIAADKALRMIAMLFSEFVDDAAIAGDLIRETGDDQEYQVRSFRRRAIKSFMDRQKEVEVKQSRDPQVDVSFSIAFLPMSETDIIGAFFCEDADLARLWMSAPGVEDYHYQNATDRPKAISEDEWEQRRLVWSQVLPGNASFDSRMFIAEIVPVEFCPIHRLDRLHEFLPSLAMRAQMRARNRVQEEAFEGYKEKLREGHFLSAVVQSLDYAASKEAKPMLEAYQAKYAEMLPNDLERMLRCLETT